MALRNEVCSMKCARYYYINVLNKILITVQCVHPTYSISLFLFQMNDSLKFTLQLSFQKISIVILVGDQFLKLPIFISLNFIFRLHGTAWDHFTLFKLYAQQKLIRIFHGLIWISAHLGNILDWNYSKRTMFRYLHNCISLISLSLNF